MRIVLEIPHPRMKITCFHHNQKYSIKFEKNLIEHILKFRELSSDITITGITDLISDEKMQAIEKSIDHSAEIRNQLIPDTVDNDDFPHII